MFSTLVYCVHDKMIVLLQQGWMVGFITFNTTFNNISVISWWSVLLMEQTKYQEKTTNLPQVNDKLYHIMLYRVHLA